MKSFSNLLTTFLVLTVVPSFSIASAPLPKIQNCKIGHENLFPSVLKSSKQSLSKVIADLNSFNEKESLSFLDRLSFEFASKTLSCIEKHFSAVTYLCDTTSSPNHIASTDWFWGKEVILYPRFWSQSLPAKRSSIIHEIAHKCLAIDGASSYEKPRSKLFLSWSLFADTYGYWVEHGFCNPKEDC